MTRNHGNPGEAGVCRKTVPTRRARRGNPATSATLPYVQTRPRGIFFTAARILAASLAGGATFDSRRADGFALVLVFGFVFSEVARLRVADFNVRATDRAGVRRTTFADFFFWVTAITHLLAALNRRRAGGSGVLRCGCEQGRAPMNPRTPGPAPIPKCVLDRHAIVHRLLRSISAIRIATSLAAGQRDAKRSDERQHAFEEIARRIGEQMKQQRQNESRPHRS